MARIRSIKPEFWDDRKLARLVSRDARMLYIGLWNQADEHARCNGDPDWVKGHVFPYDDDLTDEDCARLLAELVGAHRVIAYEVDGDPYLYLPKLGKHQRLEPQVKSKLPPPPEPDPNGSAPRAEKSAPHADKSAPAPPEPSPDAERSSLLYVAGSMEHVEEPSPRPPAAGSDDDPHFVAFWDAYPRKVDKGHARKAWRSALRRGVEPAVIVAAVEHFGRDPTRAAKGAEFTPYPATWLNGERYNDALPEPNRREVIEQTWGPA